MYKCNADDSDRYFCQIQRLRIICWLQVPGITLACCWSPAPLTPSANCCWPTTWPPLLCRRRSARGWTWLCPTTRPSLLLSSAWLSPRGRRGSLECAWNDASLCTLLTLPGMLQWMGSMIGWLGLSVSLPVCSGRNCLGHFVWQSLIDLCVFFKSNNESFLCVWGWCMCVALAEYENVCVHVVVCVYHCACVCVCACMCVCMCTTCVIMLNICTVATHVVVQRVWYEDLQWKAPP